MFVEGHVEKHTLNASLRKSGQFIEQDENPLWRRARHWFEHGWDELSDLVEECECYLFETDPIEAGPYLHIAEAVLNIHISIWPPAENEAFKQKIIDRIRSFVGSQGVATATMGRNFGWGERVMEGEPQFSFGGYTYQIDVSTRDIINAMRDVQLELYDSEKPQILSGLMTDFQTDLAKFKERISRSIKDDTFYDVPFFHELDADEFAKAVISHLKKGHFEELGSMFERAEMRHNPSEKWAQERDWFVTVRSKLEELTSDHPPLVRAHMDKFFKSHWKFKSNAQVE